MAVTLTPAGRRLRARAERIPPAVMARLGMGLTELEELRDRLTTVIEAARRPGSARRTARGAEPPAQRAARAALTTAGSGLVCGVPSMTTVGTVSSPPLTLAT